VLLWLELASALRNSSNSGQAGVGAGISYCSSSEAVSLEAAREPAK